MEYIIWGKSPNAPHEQVLHTLSKSKEIAEKVMTHLQTEYDCTELRLQILDLNEKPDFSNPELLNI